MFLEDGLNMFYINKALRFTGYRLNELGRLNTVIPTGSL